MSRKDQVLRILFALDRHFDDHSRVPVAVVAMAIASPVFARGRFPKLRLVDVVAKAPAMDGREQRALATVCGANIDGLPEGLGACAGVRGAPGRPDHPL